MFVQVVFSFTKSQHFAPRTMNRMSGKPVGPKMSESHFRVNDTRGTPRSLCLSAVHPESGSASNHRSRSPASIPRYTLARTSGSTCLVRNVPTTLCPVYADDPDKAVRVVTVPPVSTVSVRL